MSHKTFFRADLMVLVLVILMGGFVIGLATLNWISNHRMTTEYAIPEINPEDLVDEPDTVMCDCIEFIDPDVEEVDGSLCQCPTEDGLMYVFEGNTYGLADLYLYLEEAMANYLDEREA